jgi:iron complex outermembrane receptor protein
MAKGGSLKHYPPDMPRLGNQHRYACSSKSAYCLGLIFLCAASTGHADSSAEEPLPAPQSLPEVVVTAPAIIAGNEVSNYGVGYSIVGMQQMADLNATDIASTLRTTPGVNISRYNSVGSYGGSGGGAIFIRGMGASRPGSELLTMYDGVPRYNAVFSHPLLDILSIDPAGAIHVYKGVQPQFFGNAFAAIDITPKQKLDDGFTGEIFGAFGTDNTVVEKVSTGGRVNGFDYYLGQSFRRSSGDRPNSGGEIQDYFLRLGHELGDNWAVSFFGDHTNNYAEDPGEEGSPYHMGIYRTNDFLSVLTLANRYEHAEGYIKPYWNTGEARWLDQGMQNTGAPVLPGATRNTRMDWDLYGIRAREKVLPWEGAEIITGMDVDVMSGKADFETYNPSQSTRFAREDFQIYSPYAAISHRFGTNDGFYLQPSGGLRFYEHNVFGSEWAPHGGVIVGYKDTELHAAYSRGVSYPGLNVAAFSQAILPPIYNDPTKRDAWKDLEAETLNHYEIGISHRFTPQLKADVTGFWDEGSNRYVLAFPASGAPVPIGFQNISSYRNHGIESSITYEPIPDFSFFVGVTWLQSSVTGMPYAPEWTVSSGFTWNFLTNFRLSVDLLYQDRMYVNPVNAYPRSGAPGTDPRDNPQVPSAVILNAKVSYFFEMETIHLKQGEIFLALENITDRKYYYRPGYPMPGIGGMLGVRLSF